eukprot:gnl/Dysnectes_brevis/650_a718_3975.p1 GENE.gnl/Dysnectes_brevis/650_a718_3975~~gnl/Dysnectes_brevis/650_a718_3975.p1  ORF type:complete len:239 (+),score=84.12 gnl/Dysnectes_brevis/650_a718_3975:30-746(+)
MPGDTTAHKKLLKHQAPEGSSKPSFRCRYNSFGKKLVININVHRIPAQKMKLNVKKKYFHFDTMEHSKKLWVEASYPNGIRIDPATADVQLKPGLLQITIPVTDVPTIEKPIKKTKKHMIARSNTDGTISLPAPIKPRVVTVPKRSRRANRAQQEAAQVGGASVPHKPGKQVSMEEQLRLARVIGRHSVESQEAAREAERSKELQELQVLEAREKKRDAKDSKKKRIAEAVRKRIESK